MDLQKLIQRIRDLAVNTDLRADEINDAFELFKRQNERALDELEDKDPDSYAYIKYSFGLAEQAYNALQQAIVYLSDAAKDLAKKKERK